ncbi:MAG: PilZ domain-containing protein [Pseudomonadota bacterium]
MEGDSMSAGVTDLFSASFFANAALFSRREITTIGKQTEIQKFFSRLFVEDPSIKISLLKNGMVTETTISAVQGPEFVEGVRTTTEKKGPFSVVLRCLNEVYIFELGGPESGLPERIYKVHRRFSDRYSTGEFSITAKLRDPKGNSFSGKLVDYSDRGFGFLCPTEAEQVPLLEEIEAEIAGQAPVTFKGEVAHLTADPGKKDVRVGLRLTRAADPSALADFQRSLLPKLFPAVREARSDADFDRVADLLTVMAGVARLPNRANLIALWKSLGQGPDRPAEVFLEQRAGKSVATMTAAQVYSRTCFLHTFAIEKKEAFALPVEMFHRMRDFAMREKGAEFVCGMWPAGHRFMERYYAEFVRRDFDPADHHFETVEVTRFTSSGNGKRSPRFDVATATREEEATAWETIRSTASPVLFEAADWGEKDLSLQKVGEAYRKAGHLRSREIVALREKGKLLAFATVEYSSGGAGVFGLANSFRIYFCEGSAVEQPAIGTALITDVLGRYADRKIPTGCLYGNEKLDWLKGIPGFEAALGSVSLWIVRRTRAKAFLRHLERVNWELSLFRGGKTRVRPSLLQAFDYQSEPFKPRKCMRLEDAAGVDGVSGRLKRAGESACPVRLANLDTYGACLIPEQPFNVEVGDDFTLELKLGNAPEMTLQALVRFSESRIAPGFQAQALVIGIEFIGAPIGHLESIRDFVFSRLNPEVKLFCAGDFDPLAELLQRSKYLDYFESTDHERIIREAKPTFDAINKLYPDLARVTVLRSDRLVIGSHSFFRMNSRTWQLHQLAVDPDLSLYKKKIPTKIILQSTFEYLCLDPRIEYFVTYFNDDAAIARAYFEAGQSHHNARDVAFVPTRWTPIEHIDAARPPIASRSAEATSEEVAAISDYLTAIVPKLEYESLEYSDPLLRKFLKQWTSEPIDRVRKVFVARDKKGEIRVFVLANLCPPSLNFLGVLDNFRLFEVPWCNVDTRQMRLDLVSHTLDYYKKAGRERAYFEMDERDPADYSAIGISPVGRTWRLIANKSAFLTALQFFLGRYGRLEERLIAQEGKGR